MIVGCRWWWIGNTSSSEGDCRPKDAEGKWNTEDISMQLIFRQNEQAYLRPSLLHSVYIPANPGEALMNTLGLVIDWRAGAAVDMRTIAHCYRKKESSVFYTDGVNSVSGGNSL